MKSLKNVSEVIDYLMTELRSRNISQCVNIIILSDHGHADSVCGNSLFLKGFDGLLKGINIKEKFTGTMGRMRASGGIGKIMVESLKIW